MTGRDAGPGGEIERHAQWMTLRNLRPSTIRDRRRLLVAVTLRLGKPAAAATAADLAAWQRSIAAISPDCQANYVSHLREFYRWLQAEGIREDHPAACLVMPRLGRRLPRPIDTADLMTAVVSAPARIRPWLVLAAWAGLRCTEIALLRRESVMDRAAEPYILVTAQTSKGPHERTVPMCGTLLAELLPVLPARGWAFPRLDGEPGPNRPGRISAVGNLYLHDLGLTDTMHSLRHWFGTRAYEATRDLRAVQELLGHRSARSTELYTRISDGARSAAVNALPPLAAEKTRT